jgi:hypothetical protein
MRYRLISILFLATLLILASRGSGVLRAADSQRNFVVLYECLDNSSAVKDTVEYIFNDMLGPDDLLIIYSPVRLYSFSKTTLARPKAELISMMEEKLRGDASKAAQDYKEVIKEMASGVRTIESMVLGEESSAPGEEGSMRDLRNLFMLYRQALGSLSQLRKVNEAALRQIGELFRKQRGQNHIILLFEREFRPIPNRDALNVLHDMPIFGAQANELFASDNLKALFATDAIGEFFKQVPLTLHFLYIKSNSNFTTGAILENSADVYAAFSKIAKITGGVCETITEPVAGLKSIMTALKEAK